MSLNDLQSILGGLPVATEVVDVEPGVRVLGSESEQIHADDSELLARLESADTMASGVEARLDEILGTLDDLLIRLRPNDSDESRQVVTSRSEPGPSPPEQS